MFTAAVKLLRWSLCGTHISQILLPRLQKEQYHFQMDQKIHLCSGVFAYLWITYNVLCCHLRNTFYNPAFLMCPSYHVQHRLKSALIRQSVRLLRCKMRQVLLFWWKYTVLQLILINKMKMFALKEQYIKNHSSIIIHATSKFSCKFN